MSTKLEHLANPNSCMNKANDEEIVFVLLARDEAAPICIDVWCMERIRLGKNTMEDAQIVEAMECAKQMQLQHANRFTNFMNNELPQPPKRPPGLKLQHTIQIDERGVTHEIFVPRDHKLNVIELTQTIECMLNGEPVFILRAQDKDAQIGIAAYQNKISDTLQRIIECKPFAPVTTEAIVVSLNNVLKRTKAALNKFFDWQRQNSTRVKQAD